MKIFYLKNLKKKLKNFTRKNNKDLKKKIQKLKIKDNNFITKQKNL